MAMFRTIGSKTGVASSSRLGYVARLQASIASADKDHHTAATLWRESLTLHREQGDSLGMAKCLEGLAAALGEDGQPERAARLLGAAEVLRETIRAPLAHLERAGHEERVSRLRSALGDAVFAARWGEGRAMTVAQAVDHALAEDGNDRRNAQDS